MFNLSFQFVFVIKITCAHQLIIGSRDIQFNQETRQSCSERHLKISILLSHWFEICPLIDYMRNNTHERWMNELFEANTHAFNVRCQSHDGITFSWLLQIKNEIQIILHHNLLLKSIWFILRFTCKWILCAFYYLALIKTQSSSTISRFFISDFMQSKWRRNHQQTNRWNDTWFMCRFSFEVIKNKNERKNRCNMVR